jgi:pseudouridine-5'-phosphate glycosidase
VVARSLGFPDWLHVDATVAAALQSRRPVVALESALVTHGLPAPTGVLAVERQAAALGAAGAVPAVVAVCDGLPRLGVDVDQLRRLASGPSAKVSSWDLAGVMAARGWGGTTVAVTARVAAAAGVRMLSTGGVGGVHPGGGRDVSNDITALAHYPVCVVCTGPKSIVDAALTLEVLETLGVPVVGWKTRFLPGFWGPTTGLPLPARVDDTAQAAALLRAHWAVASTGVLMVQELPPGLAFSAAELQDAQATASANAARAGVRGADLTPYLLAALRDQLGGRASEVNLALLERNAHLAGQVASAYQAVQ